MRDEPNSWEARAERTSLYGFTDLPSVEARGTVVLTHGEGPYVIDTHGRRYLDANSGLWNMVAGFDNPELIAAAKAQYDRFPGYHAFFGRMSDQTVMLSEKLVEVSPFARGKVFYTNSGSEANDTMVKMLWFLHRAEHLVVGLARHRRADRRHPVIGVPAGQDLAALRLAFGPVQEPQHLDHGVVRL